MAELHELIQKIENPELRKQIQEAANRLTKQKKFGLVFEEHLPECTPLYDIPVRKGSKVSLRAGKVNETYTVLKIESEKAVCLAKNSKDTVEFDVAELVVTAEFGEPIYPYLKYIDSVCNAPDNDLWHTLIEADNYHALQLLEYLYAGKVDCIYIDPPYNTGAKDWKYNNDYVDGSDAYRHSKWLSFIQKRLTIAKRLLNPRDSVLVVTIDEKEYLHLGCLLEEMFPEADMQMITSVINAKGAVRDGKFSRVEEYIFVLTLGEAKVNPLQYNMLDTTYADVVNEPKPVEWLGFRRREASSVRSARPNQFYPIYVDNETGYIREIGDRIDNHILRDSIADIDGCTTLWPLKPDGTEMLWGLTPNVARENLKAGFLRVNNWDPVKKKGTVQYLQSGVIKGIEDDTIEILGYQEDGSVIAQHKAGTNTISPKRVWNNPLHNAENYGTNIVKACIGQQKFTFPKSLYAVEDIIKFYEKNNKEALILDFFAGSGTTLHAVNLLNSEDGGSRRCIIVTNNEVSEAEAKTLTKKGYRPGDDEWEKLGIARSVTWTRTVCSITGNDINGQPIKGKYLYTDANMSDGFKTNAVYFKLGFLDRTKVSLGMQFKELISTLWMKAGAIGICPVIEGDIPQMLVLPENHMAILNEENCFGAFVEEVKKYEEIKVVYLVTDYEDSFVSMSQVLSDKITYQLYRDYLDNFRINAGRNAR